MSKISIHKIENEIIIRYDNNNYVFGYDTLYNIINEAGIPCKVSTFDVPGIIVSRICKYFEKNGVDAKSFNAFSDKNKPNKFIIKIREKNKINNY